MAAATKKLPPSKQAKKDKAIHTKTYRETPTSQMKQIKFILEEEVYAELRAYLKANKISTQIFLESYVKETLAKIKTADK